MRDQMCSPRSRAGRGRTPAGRAGPGACRRTRCRRTPRRTARPGSRRTGLCSRGCAANGSRSTRSCPRSRLVVRDPVRVDGEDLVEEPRGRRGSRRSWAGPPCSRTPSGCPARGTSRPAPAAPRWARPRGQVQPPASVVAVPGRLHEQQVGAVGGEHLRQSVGRDGGLAPLVAERQRRELVEHHRGVRPARAGATAGGVYAGSRGRRPITRPPRGVRRRSARPPGRPTAAAPRCAAGAGGQRLARRRASESLAGDEPVGAVRDRDRALGVGPQRQARDAEHGGLLLHAAGVGDHDAAPRTRPRNST